MKPVNATGSGGLCVYRYAGVDPHATATDHRSAYYAHSPVHIYLYHVGYYTVGPTSILNLPRPNAQERAACVAPFFFRATAGLWITLSTATGVAVRADKQFRTAVPRTVFAASWLPFATALYSFFLLLNKAPFT